MKGTISSDLIRRLEKEGIGAFSSNSNIEASISLQKQASKVVYNKKNGDVTIKKETKDRNRRSAKVANSDDEELERPSK